MTLVPTFTLGDLALTEYPFSVEFGTDYGAPQNVYQVVQSLLVDGEDVSSPRSSNRTISITVLVEGADLLELAENERTLLLECEKPRNTFTVDPGDGYAELGVFQTFRAQVVQMPSEDLEMANLRRYQLTMQAMPFVRAADPTTVSLTYSGTTPTTLKDGTSTTGVTGNNGTGRPLTLSTVTYLGETAIKGTPSVARDTGWSDPYDEYVFSSVALTAALPFFAVDVALDSPLNLPLDPDPMRVSMTSGGSTVSLGAPIGFNVLSSGFRRFYFSHSFAGSTVDVAVRVRMQQVFSGGTPATYVGGIYSAPSAPAAGLLIGGVAGSERAPVSVKVARSSSGSLGRVTLFSDPAMLQYGYNPGASASWVNAPAGSYTVGGATGAAGQTYVLTINGQSSTTYCKNTGDELWFEFHLGSRKDGHLGTLTTSATANGSPTTLTGLRLYRNAPETALVSLPSVTARYLWVESPTLERPEVGIWAGASADGSDATSVVSSANAADVLMIAPPLYALWVDSTSTGLDVEATYYPLSHTFVSSRVGAA